jgi:O-antigen ligase
LEAVFETVRNASFALFAALLFAVPLPLASARDWAWSPLALVIGVIVLALSAAAIFAPHRDTIPLGTLIPPAIAFAALVLWAFVQAGLPFGGLGSNPLIGEALTVLGRSGPQRLAIDPEAARTGAMRWLAYAGSFWIAVEAARDARHARRLLVAIVLCGVAITVYGLLAELAEALQGIWPGLVPKIDEGFSGTFVNRNHYATYVGLCILITLALISFEAPRSAGRTLPLRLRLRTLAMRLSGATGVYVAILVVLFAGLIETGSRAGLLSFLAGLVVFAVLGSRRPLVAIGTSLVIIVLLMALPAAGTLLNRFAGLALGSAEHERIEVYSTALQAISLRPWTGWGVGSWAGVYSLLQPLDLSARFNDVAHNTYLELAVELGIPFGAVLTLVVLWIDARCALGLRERSRHRELPALAIAATVLVGVHSLVDFSLQIPAVPITFAAVLGIGWAQSWSSRRDGG